jgi:hypothetical protein
LIDKVDVATIAHQRSWRRNYREKKTKSEKIRYKLLSLSSSFLLLGSAGGVVITKGDHQETYANENKSKNVEGRHRMENNPIYGNIPDQLWNNSTTSLETGGTHSPTCASLLSMNILFDYEYGEDGDEDETWQDIEEVWFPGAHGDIGGGWNLPTDEEPLSHGPLVWMVLIFPSLIKSKVLC